MCFSFHFSLLLFLNILLSYFWKALYIYTLLKFYSGNISFANICDCVVIKNEGNIKVNFQIFCQHNGISFFFILIMFQSLSPSFGCLDSYQKLEQLGEGSYATVYKGICRFVLCAEQFVVIECSGLHTMSQIIIVRSEVKNRNLTMAL